MTPIYICWSYGSLHTTWSCDSLLYSMCILSCMDWILFGANRTPPFIPWSKKIALSGIRFVLSCRFELSLFRVECDSMFDLFFLSASHLPLPSHTTHSVGSTGRALWVYAVCGVWGGWVGSFVGLGVRYAGVRTSEIRCDASAAFHLESEHLVF